MTETPDPYAGEPAEESLPPKPPIDPDADALEEYEDPGEEDLDEELFMPAGKAADDDTVDDAETDRPPTSG
jgi:hypothetical protein